MHLRRVAAKAAELARAMRPGDEEWERTVAACGLLHDLGKYRPEFQAYLAGELAAAPHAIAGAAAARPLVGDAGTFAIAGHHAGLHNAATLKERLGDWGPGDLEPLCALAAADGVLPLAAVAMPPRADLLAAEVRTRMLFSALVDADRLMSEMHDMGEARAAAGLEAERCLAALRTRTAALAASPCGGELERRVRACREQILAACLAGANEPPGLFSLTVPTGGGKTLAGMAFALAHAARYGLRRIVVVIPYLSIIEQNAAVYEAVFGPGVVLEHHSAVTPPAARVDEDAVSPYEPATENWDAPIIVTTTVRLVETLFAARPAAARRLHNIARAVLLLDECQTLPIQLLDPLVHVLGRLSSDWGASIVMSSATQPGFERSDYLKSGFAPASVREIAPEPAALARQLRRVSFAVDPADRLTEWDEIADEVARSPQVLCVVNLRRHAADLWAAVRARLPDSEQAGLFHLSSLMCPQHRLERLGAPDFPAQDTIRGRLRAGLPCRLVSTQVVEAGVDVDFPLVLRALAPLEAIVQAAGRCNREGRLTDETGAPILGRVRVFRPGEGGPPGWYGVATQVTAGWLDRTPAEDLATSPALFADYFRALWRDVPTDRARKRTERPLQEERRSFNYRAVAERARVIDADTVPIAVPWGEGAEIIRDIRGARHATRASLRRLQRYLVNVQRHADLARLQRDGQVEALLPGLDVLWLVRPESYCPHRGLRLGLPPEAFVI